jgi:hypothetical protein
VQIIAGGGLFFFPRGGSPIHCVLTLNSVSSRILSSNTKLGAIW